MAWPCSRRCCWKWRSENFVECYDPMWQKKPDIVVVNKNDRSCAIIDIATPADIRASTKEKGKIWEIQGTKERNQKAVEHQKH